MAVQGAVNMERDVTILIVDDEASIRTTLSSVLHDEGYKTVEAESGEAALGLLASHHPSLVLLDIWLQGMDGLEVLSKLRTIAPDIPVIMISGHATIATAIRATRLGASDFIEKPLDLNATIRAIHRALSAQSSPDWGQGDGSEDDLRIGESPAESLRPLVFADQFAKGREFPQRTLKRSALLYGQGLHSGRKSGLALEPLPAGSGIHFAGVADLRPVPAHIDFVESTGFATTVRLGQTQAGTIEHLMSALHAYGICNLLVKCNGEVPVMDGSASEFCALIEQVGVAEQGGGWYEIAVPRLIRVGSDTEYIQIEPADDFTIDYTLRYPAPLGHQRMVFTLDDVAAYKREIAPARTFGFVRDVGALQKQGLALGGRFDNFILFGEEGPINDKLRFEDEPVRHKILDAIGDLFLLGRRLRGRVTASMTGHSDNVALLRNLRDALRGHE